MRVLWICNIMLPSVAVRLGKKPSNKEGWLSGIIEKVKVKKDFELSVAFPVGEDNDGYHENIDGIDYYGFVEDTAHPENYDEALETRLRSICEMAGPQVVHLFGTEFPHTLAMLRVAKDAECPALVGMQGVMGIYVDRFTDGVPDYVIRRKTLRDILRKDSIIEQVAKFADRAVNEKEALKICRHITGRTDFDKDYVLGINPEIQYHFMNETLRTEFYEGQWKYDECNKHSVFLSQGNYPIKGAHYMFEAVNILKHKYPDIKVRIAGDVITRHKTVKEKIKISSYGKYLLELIKKYNIEDNIEFVGNKTAVEIKDELLSTNVFVCPSTIENSPNSLGEAMLLSVPCVSANVGGISSIFTDKRDGILYEAGNVEKLAEALDKMFSDVEYAVECGKNANEHARVTHDGAANYARLLEIYSELEENK